MNREVKFKAKDKETGKWVFGFVKYALSGNAYIDSPLSDGGWDSWQVEPSTVSQLIAVENDIEFYDNDIVADIDDINNESRWLLQIEGMQVVERFWHKKPKVWRDVGTPVINMKYRKVLGNIND